MASSGAVRGRACSDVLAGWCLAVLAVGIALVSVTGLTATRSPREHPNSTDQPDSRAGPHETQAAPINLDAQVTPARDAPGWSRTRLPRARIGPPVRPGPEAHVAALSRPRHQTGAPAAAAGLSRAGQAAGHVHTPPW